MKYGIAHLSSLMFGSISFAIAYNTNIFVNKVANYPSNFMLWDLIKSSIPVNNSTPSKSSS